MSKRTKLLDIKGGLLIEVLFYSVMLSLILLVLLQVGVFLARSSQETSARSLLVSESSVVMNRIARGVSNGETFNDVSSILSDPESEFSFVNKDGDTIVYRLNNDKIEQGTNGNFDDMHSSDVIVTSFQVDQLNSSTSNSLFRISIDFTNIYGDEFNLVRSVNFLYE